MEINDKNIINRLKRTEGQIRGIQKMIEEEKDCMAIITQLSAVRSSIDRVMGMIVAENLRLFGASRKQRRRASQKNGTSNQLDHQKIRRDSNESCFSYR